MKKQTITLIIFFVGILGLKSQDCKYQYYNYWIGKGMSEFHTNNFKEASISFKKALTKVNFPLGSDLEGALKTAVATKDTLWAETLSIKLAKGGIPLIYFKSLENMVWYDKFKEDYLDYHSIYADKFDLVLREKLLQLRFQDSLYNENYHKWRRNELEMTLDELTEGAENILSGFKILIKEHGFPCEQKMGYYYKENKIQDFPISILLIHIYQRGELLYKDRLGKIVCDGKLRVVEQVSLNSFKGFGNSTGVKQEMEIRYKKYRPNE